jgi:hypothetical protein
MSNYTIKITKLSHYIGDNEIASFKKGQITKQEYEYSYQEFGEALDEYRNKCKESASSICIGVCFFDDFTIQLIRNIDNQIEFHFHCNNL